MRHTQGTQGKHGLCQRCYDRWTGSDNDIRGVRDVFEKDYVKEITASLLDPRQEFLAPEDH